MLCSHLKSCSQQNHQTLAVIFIIAFLLSVSNLFIICYNPIFIRSTPLRFHPNTLIGINSIAHEILVRCHAPHPRLNRSLHQGGASVLAHVCHTFTQSGTPEDAVLTPEVSLKQQSLYIKWGFDGFYFECF